MKTITTLALMLIGLAGFAQVDQERMNRDLKVAENVIATLLEQEDNSLFGRAPVRGTYVENYGVVFWANNSRSRIRVRGLRAPQAVYEIQGSATSKTVIARSNNEGNTIEVVNIDSLRNNREEMWIEKMKTFLADYGDLIGQLKPTDKIMITTNPKDSRDEWMVFTETLTVRDDEKKESSITLEIVKNDLSQFKQGKINREQLLNKISVSRSEEATAVAQDVELLASIFERLYKPDLSTTYYVTGRIHYKAVPNFGIIYTFRVYSSVMDNNGLYSIRTLGKNGVNQEERNATVKGLYPEFLQQLKQNIANYGRTVQSPGDGDMLMFDIQLTECKDCGIPERIEVSVKASDLKSLASGKLSESQFMDKISLKEIGKQ